MPSESSAGFTGQKPASLLNVRARTYIDKEPPVGPADTHLRPPDGRDGSRRQGCGVFSCWRRRRRTEELAQRLDEVAQRLEQVLNQDAAHRVQVTIQHLHVERAMLDQLLFRLGDLDINELSGSLNLGNNFGIDALHSLKDVAQNPAAGPVAPAPRPGSPTARPQAQASGPGGPQAGPAAAPEPNGPAQAEHTDPGQPAVRPTNRGYQVSFPQDVTRRSASADPET